MGFSTPLSGFLGRAEVPAVTGELALMFRQLRFQVWGELVLTWELRP